MTGNIEEGIKFPPRTRLEGYPSFAAFIARDHDAAIYRRFEDLSSRNLLYLQSELLELREQLIALDDRDARSSCFEAEGAARTWRHYISDSNPRAAEHRALQGKIKTRIKEYHEALLLESQVLTLQKPDSRSLKNFKRWFRSGTSDSVLLGRDGALFDEEEDLVALTSTESDRLTRLIRKYLGWFLQERKNHPKDCEDIYYFPERRIQFASAIVATFFSAILLIGAICCLLAVADQSRAIQISMLVLFTCIFAAVVGLLTNSRRAEIFGSTAAYAAVLVVFISNPIGSSTHTQTI